MSESQVSKPTSWAVKLLHLITRSALAVLMVAGILALALPVGFYGMYLYIEPELPTVTELKRANFKMPLQVYTKDQVFIAEYGNDLSIPVTFDQVPKPLIHAFLAAEDDGFFEHDGISIKGLGRAISESVTGHDRQSGGSTITMQVAKNYFLNPDRTFKRKLTEIFLARRIEQHLTKEEIFTLYVNKIYLGSGAYGIQAAAKKYYSKPLSELSLGQMAVIAGLPKAPSTNNPVTNPERAMERRDWILARMFGLGFIDNPTFKAATEEELNLKLYTSSVNNKFPYLTEWVRYSLVGAYGQGITSSGWKVTLSVDSKRQAAAETALKKGLLAYESRHGWQGPEGKGEDLNVLYTYDNRYPARITRLEPSTIYAELKNGQKLSVAWKSVKRYINPNSTGYFPSDATKALKVGQIIRVRPTNEEKTSWRMVTSPSVQGALIALNPENGAVEAMVGGYDFYQSKFNRVTQGWRQPGSILKPFVYALALEKGYRADSLISDEKLSIGSWSPKNSDGRYLGRIPLNKALYLSRNLASIRLLRQVGVSDTRQYLSQFGLYKDKLPANLTLALGTGQALPIQMATAYATFANGGFRVEPYLISSIESPTGQTLYAANPEVACSVCVNKLKRAAAKTSGALFVEAPQAPRVMSPVVSTEMARILRDVVQRGTGTYAKRMGRNDIGGKTGTTNDAKDAWFAGFQKSLVAVAWVGFDTPRSLGRREYGGVAALPIWTDFMQSALEDTPVEWINTKVTDTKSKNSSSKEDTAKTTKQVSELAEEPKINIPVAYYISRPTKSASKSSSSKTANQAPPMLKDFTDFLLAEPNSSAASDSGQTSSQAKPAQPAPASQQPSVNTKPSTDSTTTSPSNPDQNSNPSNSAAPRTNPAASNKPAATAQNTQPSVPKRQPEPFPKPNTAAPAGGFPSEFLDITDRSSR